MQGARQGGDVDPQATDGVAGLARAPAVVVRELTQHSLKALPEGVFDAVIFQDRRREITTAVGLLPALVSGMLVDPDPDAGRIGIEVVLRDNLP
ncbi:hypothetical protein E4191_19815 (plasmid) [Paracoccus liaowanqingii]|uniref:Uncharacterized protein n=1 Tax=Paracoccus liaowanqingii TaxID=2560053 RepID=A0A4Y5SUD4_9RHOB|nr:hypothetical protein [Paracoccus liaowanqingii]QDA36366.1 hypothetical protein E4191_19815 [Paracoccus liaowanqingii]